MRKVIAAINMTLDGFCDHTAITPDDAIHNYYANLINEAGVLLYGRKTYQLMEYWRDILENPTGIESIDNFARVMDKTPKIVFSHTLQELNWHSAHLADMNPNDKVRELKKTAWQRYSGWESGTH